MRLYASQCGSGGQGIRTTCENTGKSEFSKVRGTNPTRNSQLPNIEAPETDLLAIAKQSIGSSRQAVEKLIDSISLDDHFALGILGPILSGLRDAENEIANLTPPESKPTDDATYE